jgi:glycosyltransferase involved in cell wall biosynthesis
MINYSIIIPHKNIPNLLQRCLDSIPKHDDVQVIVADDNSDILEVNGIKLNDLPEKYPYVEWIWGKNENGRKGAGYARNLGLERAKGKWLVFADADDFFAPELNKVLYDYKDNESDIIYFKSIRLDSNTLKIINRDIGSNHLLDEIILSKEWDKLIAVSQPWGKFIKHNIITQNNILFQESLYSNDVFFSAQVATVFAKRSISNKTLYCTTYRNGSLTTQDTLQPLLIRFFVALGTFKYLKEKGKERYFYSNVTTFMRKIFYLNKKKGLCLLPTLIRTFGMKSVVDDLGLIIKRKLNRPHA